MTTTSRFEVYQGARMEWRWKLRASDGVVLARSLDGYTSKQACLGGIRSVKGNVGEAEVRDADASVEVR